MTFAELVAFAVIAGCAGAVVYHVLAAGRRPVNVIVVGVEEFDPQLVPDALPEEWR